MTVKDSVRQILEENIGSSCSGEEIAAKLSVTRAAVWKAVRALIDDGCIITSCPSKGYTLIQSSLKPSAEAIRAALPAAFKDIEIIVLDSVDSTNNYAKAHMSKNTMLIVSSEQTNGRGRMGRQFYSPAGGGVYFSVVIHPSEWQKNLTLITVAAAVSAARAIEHSTKERAQIKWVNDIFLNNRKVCGILSEAVFGVESGTIDSVIVGTGINLCTKNEDFPEPLHNIAGSVFPKNTTVSAIVADAVANLLSFLTSISENELINEYRKRLFILGKRVSYTKNKTTHTGIAEDINNLGNLIIRLDDGNTDILSAGEISLSSAAIVESLKNE